MYANIYSFVGLQAYVPLAARARLSRDIPWVVGIKISAPTSIQVLNPEVLTTWSEAEGECKDGVHQPPSQLCI